MDTNYKSVSASSMREQKRNDCFILDVREPAEYKRAHIPEAVNIPLSSLPERKGELAGASQIVVCCQSGMRAKRACESLASCTSAELLLLEGGINAWKNEGLPIHEDLSAPISIERQVRIIAGALCAIGATLGAFVSPWFLVVPIFVGCGLVFAGVTNTCGMAAVLARLPYNAKN